MANLITGCCLYLRHFETIFQVGMNFIDSVARGWAGGWMVGSGVGGWGREVVKQTCIDCLE